MNIAAVILAAGRSTRMGSQKLLLPWGDTTILGRVIDVVRSAGVEDILVVTSKETGSGINPMARIVYHEEDSMLGSMQAGLQTQHDSVEAVLFCLGDQPQVEEGSVRSVCAAFQKSGADIVIPSYQMQRGHPWLLARRLWNELTSSDAAGSARDFLKKHETLIEYVIVDTPTILQDVDTPGDYLKFKPTV